MKNLLTKISILAACGALGIGAVGCSSSTTPTPTNNNGGPASKVMVNSLDNNSIGVEWTRDAGDVGTDTVIGVPSDGGAASVQIAASGASSAMLTSLRSGVTYAISVHAPGGASGSVTWAVATRTSSIRLFETTDPAPGDPSGLSLIAGSVAAYPTSVSAGDQTKIDIVLATDATVAGSNLSLVSAGVAGSGISPNLSGIRATIFNDVTLNVNGGLDSDYYSSDLSTLFASAINSSDVASNTDTRDAIVRVKTVDNHYARVEIFRQANGLLYGTNAAGYKFIDVVVSEQETASFPYASRGVDMKSFFATKRSATTRNAN